MPIAEDPGRPDGRLLLDDSGAEVGRFVAGERDGVPNADLFETAAGVSPEQAVLALLADLRGWRVATRVPLGHALVAAGGRPRRNAHAMSRDLVRDPAPADWLDPARPPGLALTPVDRPALELAPACLAAYPPDHLDHGDMPDPEHPEDELAEIIAGEIAGPLLHCSGLAVAADGTVAGAILVTANRGEPPLGGPWILQLFRHPEARGAGRALLRRALALATRDGLPALGLAVTHGNPAQALYAEHGFVDVLHSLSVEL